MFNLKMHCKRKEKAVIRKTFGALLMSSSIFLDAQTLRIARFKKIYKRNKKYPLMLQALNNFRRFGNVKYSEL